MVANSNVSGEMGEDLSEAVPVLSVIEREEQREEIRS